MIKYKRIISFAPSITSMLYHLDAGDNLVGITDFCHPPEEDMPRLTRIGGFYNPAWEAIFALKPDLAIMLPSGEEMAKRLENRGIVCLTVPDNSLEDIYKAITLIGTFLEKEDVAKMLVEQMEDEIQALADDIAQFPPKKVLFVAGRQTGELKSIIGAGPGSWIDDILKRLNAKNIMAKSSVPYPQVSLEAIVAANPDIIIESRPDLLGNTEGIYEAEEEWSEIGSISAAASGNVYIVTDPLLTIPGPDIPAIMSILSELIHPEQ